MALEINHDLEVNAPAETVWQVITDFDKYPEWNPFLEACESTLKPGDPIHVTVHLGKQVRRETEYIIECTPGKGFAYRMKPPPLGMLRSRRSHEIVPIDDQRCTYRSRFRLEGWLAPVVQAFMGKHLLAGFNGMSEGIRMRAESFAN